MDRDEQHLASRLSMLNDETIKPARVDLAGAMRRGRARRRNRRIAVGGSALVGMVAVLATAATLIPKPSTKQPAVVNVPPPPAVSGLRCDENTLARPTGVRDATVDAGDRSGRMLVGSYTGDGDVTEAILWSNGVPKTLRYSTGRDTHAAGVNASGTVVGYTPTVDPRVQTGWVYANGKFSTLPGPWGAHGQMINDRGQIVGVADPEDGQPPRLLFWPSATAKPVGLSAPESDWGTRPIAIDEDGTVVGVTGKYGLQGQEPKLQIIVWRRGGTYELVPRPAIPGVERVIPVTVRNGVVFAVALDPKSGDGYGTPVAYDLKSHSYLATTGPELAPYAANPSGQWVGFHSGQPAAWSQATGTVRLPRLSNDKSVDLLRTPTVISDDGRLIAGTDTDSDGVSTPVKWSCH